MPDHPSIAEVVLELSDDVKRLRYRLLHGLRHHDQQDVMQEAFKKLVTRHKPGETREQIKKRLWWCTKESRSEFYARQKKMANHETYDEAVHSSARELPL